MKSINREIERLYHANNHIIPAYVKPMAIVADELEVQTIWEERIKDLMIEQLEQW